jgi:hypothetical protein
MSTSSNKSNNSSINSTSSSPITLIYLLSTGIITIISNFTDDGYLLNYMKLDYKKVYTQYEIWRLITTFLYIGQPSPKIIFDYYIYYKRMKSTERKFIRNKKLSEFIMMLIYLMIITHICNFIGYAFFGLKSNKFLSHKLMFSIILINSKRNPEKMFRFYFAKIPNIFVPYFLFTIRTLKSGKYLSNLFSFIPGLAYYYLKDVIPKWNNNLDIFITPQFLENICKNKFYPKSNLKKKKNKLVKDNLSKLDFYSDINENKEKIKNDNDVDLKKDKLKCD